MKLRFSSKFKDKCFKHYYNYGKHYNHAVKRPLRCNDKFFIHLTLLDYQNFFSAKQAYKNIYLNVFVCACERKHVCTYFYVWLKKTVKVTEKMYPK